MVLRGLVKCSSIFFFIFLMCPKRSRLSAPLGKQQEYYQAIRKSLNEVNDDDSLKVQPAPWSPNIIRPREDLTLMGIEPGYDLSDDEIRKLKVWPRGVIPYYIDTLSFGDKVLRDRIRWFLNEVNALTKISFMEMPSPPKDPNYRWVFFINRQGQLGCADHSIRNFTNEGVQRVVLGYDCMTTGGELAEAVLAIAGVPPQHNAPYRDEYIQVFTENIIPEKRYLFEKVNTDHWLFYNVEYDFLSAGHYHFHKHSRNGSATIELLLPYYAGVSIGEANSGFSSSDIKKLRMLYNFIVNKKENKVPECDKLFRKGQNFDKRVLAGLLLPKPRKKPYQYLGLPENHSSDHHEENEAKSSKDENEHSEEKSSEGEFQKLKGKSKLKSEKKRKHRKPNKQHDPLSYLSDYQTGDDRRKK